MSSEMQGAFVTLYFIPRVLNNYLKNGNEYLYCFTIDSDQASMDELGYLYIYGRIASAQRWKVGSDVVYSAGIETVLRSHPKISACLVCSSLL